MARVFSIIGGLIGLAIVVVLVLALRQPDTFHFERSLAINAPADKIYPFINDFRRWTWSPYEQLDPNMKKTYSGSPNGKGAIYEWDGNDHAGKGRMEITEATMPSKVTLNLHFDKPFEADNVVDFTLTPKDDGTVVTWGMRGKNTFISKVMCVFISMDAMLAKDFDKGLANLKALAEK